MTAPTEERNDRDEKLAAEAETRLDENEAKKDLKEHRGIIKQTMYEGSKKLKHVLPKGKHQ
jgi:hypothetical protein